MVTFLAIIAAYSNHSSFGGSFANAKSVYIVSVFLYSGRPTNPTYRGTSAFWITLNNPGSQTSISSISVTGADITPNTVFQCSSSSSCQQLSSATLAASSPTHFDTIGTAFYFSTNFTSGHVYDYVVNLANGQTISGSLIGQDQQTSPTVSPNYSVVTSSSSSSSACSIHPYNITETSIGGNDSHTEVFTTLVSCG